MRPVDHVLRWVFAGRRLEVRRPLGPVPQTTLATDDVDRAVVHERQEEGAERAPGGVEGLGGAPERHERVVDHVLGEHRLTGDPERQPVGRAR